MSAENGAAAEAAQEIVRISPKALSQRDPVVIAKHFFQSGYFDDVKSMSQAVVKIIAGEELGLPPMAAMQGLTMIEGRLGMTGNLVATKVKQHATYDYEVIERDNAHCKIAFFEGDEELGESEFSVEDAKRAGLVKPKSNWEKYPRAMCFNRALTEGVRTFIPDVTAGTPVYTTEEIEEVVTPTPVVVEQQTATDTGERLPAETLDQLIQGYEIAGPELGGNSRLDGLNILLGSLGYDGYDLTDDFDVREVMAKWSPEQAIAVEVEFQKVLDAAADKAGQDAEEVTGEVVPDGEEAEHAQS